MVDKNKKGKTYKATLKYFNAHQCHLPVEKLSSYEIKCNRMRRCLLDLMSVSMTDVRARNMFKSYAALCAEKHRQYNKYPLSIHPFSKLRHWLEAYFVTAMFISNVLIAIHFSEMTPSIWDNHFYLIQIFDTIYVMNIIVNFFTGYVEGKTHESVVLDLNKIWLKYLRTWFVVDFITMLAFVATFVDMETAISPHLIMLSLRILRMPGWIQYLENVTTVANIHVLTRTTIHVIVLLMFYLAWNIYFQFAVEYIIEGSTHPVSPRNCSWMSIANLWESDALTRLVFSLDRAVGMLRRNVNMNLIDQGTCYEFFFCISWLIARILIYHCTLKYIVALFGCESAKAKYFIMTQQVENFMNQKKFPPRIKKKILKFYAIRFQSNFFVESKMLACVTGQLREDIIMHTGRQLVREIQFLKQMPRSLHLQIGSKLRVVVFIAGDIIFKINTIGDCLYFIDKGTVAIYSESGNEICHLEDGDFFGEIALVMKHGFRTASAVAVTNCELFRLDKEDFDSTIGCYPTIYDDIKKLAINRYERTYIMDEHHKDELKMGGDDNEE